MFTTTQIEALSAKLDKGHVKSRAQAGRSMSYVEGWHVIAEANRIFGFDAWDRETVELRQLGAPYKNAKDNTVVNYTCKVRVTVTAGDHVIVREGCGFGSGIDRDEGQAHESAIKESETDAMKRALMTFGNPFGLALYDKEQANVGSAPPAPSPAAEYVKRSLDIIDMALTKQNLRDWWKAESDTRRRVCLSQDDVNLLSTAMKAKAEKLPDNTILGAA